MFPCAPEQRKLFAAKEKASRHSRNAFPSCLGVEEFLILCLPEGLERAMPYSPKLPIYRILA
jgi:hypothetical protein